MVVPHYWACGQYWWPFESVGTNSGVDKNVSTMEIHLDGGGIAYHLPVVGKDGDYCAVWHTEEHSEGWSRTSTRAVWQGDHWVVSSCDDGTDCDGRLTRYWDWEVRRVPGGVARTLLDDTTVDANAEAAGY